MGGSTTLAREIDNPGVPPLTFETYAARWQAFDGSPVQEGVRQVDVDYAAPVFS
jgi:hypothetical protein